MSCKNCKETKGSLGCNITTLVSAELCTYWQEDKVVCAKREITVKPRERNVVINEDCTKKKLM